MWECVLSRDTWRLFKLEGMGADAIRGTSQRLGVQPKDLEGSAWEFKEATLEEELRKARKVPSRTFL